MREIEIGIDFDEVMSEVRLHSEYRAMMEAEEGRRVNALRSDSKILLRLCREGIGNLQRRFQRYIRGVEEEGNTAIIKMEIPDRGEEINEMLERNMQSYVNAKVTAGWYELVNEEHCEAAGEFAEHCLEECEKRISYRRAPRRGSD